MENIFAVWKPKGPTSHDVVNSVRRATGERRVGHAGTLDPLAEGVLVVAVGREATKKLKSIVGTDKEYLARIKLGEESSTDDAEGEKEVAEDPTVPSEKDIRSVLERFVGEINQVPPVYSAIKVSGRPAHRRIRSGEKVELDSRKIIIKEIELLNYKWPYIDLRVTTGPGVYIRALARDIGRLLGVGGYLSSLTRVRVGGFTKEKAKSISDFS